MTTTHTEAPASVAAGTEAGQRYQDHLAAFRRDHAKTVAVRAGTAVDRAQPGRAPIDGSALLSNVCKWLKRYLYLDSEAKYWALTLWVAGSHFRDENGVLVHDTFPIAGFLSDEPGSGKTHAKKPPGARCVTATRQ